MAVQEREFTKSSSKRLREQAYYVRRHGYPIFKFLVSLWLVPLVQICAVLFSPKSPNRNAPVALIVTSRSDQISSSFFCLIPQLKDSSVEIMFHSANHAKTGLISKLKHTFSFFSACTNADFVFLDDTFLPVSYAIKSKRLFRPKVVQLWHSAGLFKCVGLDVQRSKLLRYLMGINFRHFDVVTVSSEACRDAIAGFMGLDKRKVIATGTSYTDRYFRSTGKLEAENSKIRRKTIVYAPTFRGDAFNIIPSPIQDVRSILKDIESEIDCFISPHPHETADLGRFECPFTLADSLDKIDILITDYSSIAMNYILANPKGKLILYVPDLETYQQTDGFYVSLTEITPFIANDRNTLLAAIRSNQTNDFRHYREKYLNRCDGKATDRLMNFLKIAEN